VLRCRTSRQRPVENLGDYMDFPPDIVRFVELRFGQSGTQEILNLVVDGELCTPRVARSVLFLANGSMSMLRHLITRAEEDVREILVEAE
jgi:hypothetical protein